ncbi:unnamed protein product [Didymodactylos carnosus]|uniref:Uncharacterized protein n=1 Tax=Didymodactylos carnosus TaxID=1234261 RepID=A0A814FVE4_9BILA|nr:unnamed protein product [Didymodactylos carnosus]CAF3758585.1 unnamed protein product [Didymodactylos carnosus]
MGNTQPLQMNHVFHPRRTARNITINILWCSGMPADVWRAQVQMGMRTEFCAPTHFVPLLIDPFIQPAPQPVLQAQQQNRQPATTSSITFDSEKPPLFKDPKRVAVFVNKLRDTFTTPREEQKAVRRKFEVNATLETRLNAYVKRILIEISDLYLSEEMEKKSKTPYSETDARDYVFNPNNDKPDLLVTPTAPLVKHITPGSIDHIKMNNIGWTR